MSVVKLSLASGRNANFGKITENTSKVRWIGVTNNRFDTEVHIANYGYSNSILPIPYYSIHPDYPTQLCRKIDFDQDSDAPCHWEVTATYSSEPLTQSEQGQTQNPNPLDRPPKIKWKTQAYRKAVDRDLSGSALLNSAGDPFDPPVERDASYWVASIEKNVLAVPTFILDYTDAINSGPFSIQGMAVGNGVAKIMDISISDTQTEGDYTFVAFGYDLEFHPETWQLKVLDQGFREVVSGDRKQILDDSSPPRPITSPKLLNGSGGVLGVPVPGAAVFLNFDVYPERDFTVLPGLSEVA